MPNRILLHLALYMLWLLVAYAAGVGFVLLFDASPSLVQIVGAAKVVSLLILIHANREIPEAVDIDRHAGVAQANLAIVILSAITIVMMTAKLVVGGAHDALGMPGYGKAVLEGFAAHAHWAAVAPVMGYFLLDAYIAFLRRGTSNDHDIAMDFVVLRDMVCVAPLVLVAIVGELYAALSPLEDARESAAFFVNGALAVVLLSSALATKALNLIHSEAVSRRGAAVGVGQGLHHRQEPDHGKPATLSA